MSKALVWLRRDLRLWDNRALSVATNEHSKVHCVFIFDKNILKKLPRNDHRVHFLFKVLESLGHKVKVYYGDPKKLIPELAKEYDVDAVYANKDYEHYAIERDQIVEDRLFKAGVNFYNLKDHVIFEHNEVLNGSGQHYKVFTPYKNQFLKVLNSNKDQLSSFSVKLDHIIDVKKQDITKLSDISFKESSIELPSLDIKKKVLSFLDIIDNYDRQRDFPAIDGTSGLSVYLRFGLVSIRSLFIKALEKKSKGREIWISELIWRDFYSMLLQAFPFVETEEFQTKYKKIKWDKNQELFNKWVDGKTGFPLVDAGMRQLKKEGHMHNRVRMVVASFLCKTMLLDWRLGESYFAKMLFDFDLASNNGGWQWASSTGCDAAPYFRVFNPTRQSERFDKNGDYIRKYVPELEALPSKFIHNPSLMTPMDEDLYGVVLGKDYPKPCVDYKKNRETIIERFKNA